MTSYKFTSLNFGLFLNLVFLNPDILSLLEDVIKINFSFQQAQKYPICCFAWSGINLMLTCNLFLTQNITEIVVYSNAAEERPWVRGGGWEARAEQCRESPRGGEVPAGGAAQRNDSTSARGVSAVLWRIYHSKDPLMPVVECKSCQTVTVTVCFWFFSRKNTNGPSQTQKTSGRGVRRWQKMQNYMVIVCKTTVHIWTCLASSRASKWICSLSVA